MTRREGRGSRYPFLFVGGEYDGKTILTYGQPEFSLAPPERARAWSANPFDTPLQKVTYLRDGDVYRSEDK